MGERIYHGSKLLFDAFSLDNAGRSGNDTNGALGIWVTTLPWLAESFGSEGYLYEVSPPPGEIKEQSLEWLMDINDEAYEIRTAEGTDAAIAFYDKIRTDLIAKGYGQLWILEDNGTAPTRVYLDPAKTSILSVSGIKEAA